MQIYEQTIKPQSVDERLRLAAFILNDIPPQAVEEDNDSAASIGASMASDRAQEALEAAQVCLDRQLYHSATSRAYYAMFWAAQMALAHAGVRRAEWSHPALQASFVRELIRRRKRYPALLGQYVNRALQLRLDADYRLRGVSQRQATQAVRWAQEFVAAVTQEISHGPNRPGVD